MTVSVDNLSKDDLITVISVLVDSNRNLQSEIQELELFNDAHINKAKKLDDDLRRVEIERNDLRSKFSRVEEDLLELAELRVWAKALK